MARALRPPPTMTVDEFLAWNDGTDTAYELEDGVVVAMSPAVLRHGRIAQNVGAIVDERVRGRRPCRAVQAGGVVASGRARKVYVPDVVMTCEPTDGRHVVEEPRLIVEVLSPSTKGVDQRRKVPAYQSLPSVEEVWLVDSRAREVLVWRRRGADWPEPSRHTGSDSFDSPALGGPVALDLVYDLSGVDP